MVLTSIFRSSLQIAVVLALLTAFMVPLWAQSTRFDEPTPMVNGVAEGVLPGGKAVNYWSFTAVSGELSISYEFQSKGIATVGAQLTDINGRVVIDLNQREKYGNWAGDEIEDVLGTGSTTLAGRYKVPRRQTLVVKVYVDGDKTPYNYRIRVRADNVAETGPGSSMSGLTLATGPEAKPLRNNISTTRLTGSKTVTRRSTSSTTAKTRANSCLAEYQVCLKRSIVLKTPGATSQCIIQRAYCERRQRGNSVTSSSRQPQQGARDASGRIGSVQRGTRRRSKQSH